MQIEVLKSKIHRATITHAELHYEGSLTLDEDLMEAAALHPHEKIQIVNINNGSRLETYVIPGEAGSGILQLNGAAARQGAPGDLVILISYALVDESELKDHQPRFIQVDANNRALTAAK